MLVREDALEYEDLLTLGMAVGRKAATRRIAHDAGNRPELAAPAKQRLSPNRAAGAGSPDLTIGIDCHESVQVGIDIGDIKAHWDKETWLGKERTIT